MARKKRNRQYHNGASGRICCKINTCKHCWRGSERCAKNKCNDFRDPKDPKAKK